MVEGSSVNKDKTAQIIGEWWENWYVKGLSDFVECPNLSPLFDENFHTNGLTQDAMKIVDDYV
jgi:hypothetical protein